MWIFTTRHHDLRKSGWFIILSPLLKALTSNIPGRISTFSSSRRRLVHVMFLREPNDGKKRTDRRIVFICMRKNNTLKKQRKMETRYKKLLFKGFTRTLV